jgi:hypothetical protein
MSEAENELSKLRRRIVIVNVILIAALVLAGGTSLAALYYAQGQYAQAEPLYNRSLAIWEKALGPDHPDVATSL